MDLNTVIMLVIFVLLGVLVFFVQGWEGVLEGFKSGSDTLKNIWILLLVALGISGFIQVLIPKQMLSATLGPTSGMKGFLLAWAVGGVVPGAPYVILPIALSLLKAGAGIGPVMTMVLSSSIGIAITRIPLEIAFINWKFAVLRIAASIIVPLVGGFIAHYVNSVFGFFPVQGV